MAPPMASSTPTTATAAAAYWVASADSEKKKISAEESDWKLPGLGSSPPKSRTRNGGKPPVQWRKNSRRHLFNYSSSDESTSCSDWSEEDESSSEDESDDEGFVKPQSTRVIVEADPMLDFIERNSSCRQCNSEVKVNFDTTCLATSCELLCLNPACEYVDHSTPPAAANIPCNNVDNRQRTTDHSINVLFVLGFLSCGDGGKEAARVLGLLGLPNDTTMETRSFPLIESRIGGSIRQLAKDIVLETVTEEVRLTMAASPDFDDNDFSNWKRSVVEKEDGYVLPREKYPRLTASIDMGWQQKGSGRAFNSQSGHALYIGALTRKAISYCVKSKLCSGCDAMARRGLEGPAKAHECVKNHFGSSGAMESAAALDMIIQLYDEYKCILKVIVADDDSSNKATLAWSNADYMINNNCDRPPQVLIKKGKNKGQYKDRPG